MQQIVQDVEIAEALLEHYNAALLDADVGNVLVTLRRDARLEQEAAIGTAEQVYPEIWRRLDAARSAAAPTGRDLTYYDQIRAYVGNNAEIGITSRTKVTRVVRGGGFNIVEGNHEGVRAARDAIATFRRAFADAQWHDKAEPVPELRSGRKLATLITIVGAALLIAGMIAIRANL